MASTMIGAAHPNAAKVWSTACSQEALRASYFNMFIGTDEKTGRVTESDANAMITVKNELKKNKGDTINLSLRAQLQGEGVIGDETLEGNEESLVFRNDAVVVNVQRHAVRSNVGITEQRVPFNVRRQGRDGLRDWWQETYDQAMCTILAGDTAYTGRRFAGQNTITAPSHLLMANGASNSTETAVGSDATAVVTLQRLSALKRYGIETLRMRPVKTPAGPKYVVMMHDEHEMQLRNSTAAGSWTDLRKAELAGGRYKGNGLIDGSFGEFDGMMFINTDRLPRGINTAGTGYVSNTRRLVLCGAQALVMANGMDDEDGTEATYKEEPHDYGEEIGMSMRKLWGLKVSRYLSDASADPQDYGRVVLCTYTTALSSFI